MDIQLNIDDYIERINLKIPDKEDFKKAKESNSKLLSTVSIFKFLNDLKQKNMICMDAIYNSMDEIIFFDHLTYTLLINETKRINLFKCLQNDLIVIPIGIMSPILPENIGHLNVLLIDTQKNIIEYFEPFGKDNFIFVLPNIINIQELIVKKISEIFNIQHYKYINASDTCPIGLQKIDDPLSYRCGVWCMFVLYLKIYNRNLEISEIQNRLTSQTSNKNDLTILIKKFMYFIENNFKDTQITQTILKYDLLNEYIINDEYKSKIILDYLKNNISDYFKDIIDNKEINIDTNYLYKFYNIISFNKIKDFHQSIEYILKNAIINIYNQGYEHGKNSMNDIMSVNGDNEMIGYNEMISDNEMIGENAMMSDNEMIGENEMMSDFMTGL